MLVKHCMALVALYAALFVLPCVLGLQPAGPHGVGSMRLPGTGADCAPLQVSI